MVLSAPTRLYYVFNLDFANEAHFRGWYEDEAKSISNKTFKHNFYPKFRD